MMGGTISRARQLIASARQMPRHNAGDGDVVLLLPECAESSVSAVS